MIIIILLKIFLVIVFLFGSLILFFSFYSIYTIIKTKVPWAKTPQNNFKDIFSKIDLPKNSLVYDLGCGDGELLFFAEKLGYRAVGYELSLYPYLKCLFKKTITGIKITIIRKDFFNENLKNADLVFIFLVDSVMEKIGDKLINNLSPGTLVVSYGFKIPSWKINNQLDTNPSKTFFYKV